MSSVHILCPKVTLLLLEYSMYQPQMAVLEENAGREQEGFLHQDIPNQRDINVFVIHGVLKEKLRMSRNFLS